MNGHGSAKTTITTAAGYLPWLLIVAGGLVYANSLRGAFLFDDLTIVEDRGIRSLANLSTVLGDTNRPIVKLSLAVNYAIGELDVTGYHGVNIAIHILAALTLFGIVRRTLLTEPLRDRFGRSAPWLAFAVALLWLLHPLQTQAVTYIIQRSEALMGLFYLLTLYCVIRCAQERHRYIWGIAAVAACALGMGTKEVMVTAPLVVLLYDRTFLAGSFMKALRQRRGVYVGLAVTWGLLFWLVGIESLFKEHTSAGFGLKTVTPMAYALTQPGVILHYLRLTVWPHPLCLDYGWPVAEGMTAIVPPTIVIVVLLLVTAWALWRRSWLGFVGAWFFLILAPTSSIMPINDAAVEHRMYLSLAAVAVLVVIAAHQVLARTGAARHWIACVLLVAVAASLGLATARRNRDYRSAESIWQKVVDVAPHNSRGHYNLGLVLRSQGKLDGAISHYRHALWLDPDSPEAHINLGVALRSQGRADEAVSHYRRAIQLRPDHALAHNNLGVELQSQGKLDEAIRHYRRAMRAKPDYADAHTNLGLALVAQGHLDAAIHHYRRALRIDPDFAEAHYNLGVALRSQGELDEAIVHYRQALRLRPDYADAHYNLGNALVAQGKLDQAISSYRQALRVRPNDADALFNLGAALKSQGRLDEAIWHYRQALRLKPEDAKAYNSLGGLLAVTGRLDEALEHFRKTVRLKPDWPVPLNGMARILATHPDAKVRDPSQAIKLAEHAAELTSYRNATVLDTLAAAYAAAGRFDDAVTTAQNALDLALDAAGPQAPDIRKRLELYKQRKPYREPVHPPDQPRP